LHSLAVRALALRGDREDLRKLVSQLQEREDRRRLQAEEALDAATRLLHETGDARNALEKLKPFASWATPEYSRFLEIVHKAVEEENKFTLMLTAAKSDGKITPAEVVDLATQVSRCLAWNPKHPRIRTLGDQLLIRITKEPRQYLASIDALGPFFSSLNCDLPEPLRRLQAEAEAELRRSQAEAERARITAALKEGRAQKERTGVPPRRLSSERIEAIRERIKAEVRGLSSEGRVRCPVCNVECRADRLIQHFDRQHGTG